MQSACTEYKWTKTLINVDRVYTSNTVHHSRHNLMSIHANASCIIKKIQYSATKRIKLQQPTVVLRLHTVQLKMRAAGDRMQGIVSMRGSGAVCTNSGFHFQVVSGELATVGLGSNIGPVTARPQSARFTRPREQNIRSPDPPASVNRSSIQSQF